MYSLIVPKTVNGIVDAWKKCHSGKKDRNYYGRMLAQQGIEKCNSGLNRVELEEIVSLLGMDDYIHPSVMGELYEFYAVIIDPQ